jgi:hypothetical protein
MNSYIEWLLTALRYGFDPAVSVALPTGFYDVTARLIFAGVLWIGLIGGAIALFNISDRDTRNFLGAIPTPAYVFLGIIGVTFGISATRSILYSAQSPVLLWAPFCCCAAAVLFTSAFSIPRALASMGAAVGILFAITIALFLVAGVWLRAHDPILTKAVVVAIDALLTISFFLHITYGEGIGLSLAFGFGVITASFLDRSVLSDPHALSFASDATVPVATAARIALSAAFPAGLVLGVLSLLAAPPRETSETDLLTWAFGAALTIIGVLLVFFFLPTVFRLLARAARLPRPSG